jgi:hypothetical protein
MNIDKITTFFSSEQFSQLCEEADNNPEAMQLLEMINLILESAIFFHGIDEQHRVNREVQNLEKITKLINQLYEQN